MASSKPLRRHSVHGVRNRFIGAIAAAVLAFSVAGCEGLGKATEAEYLERATRHMEAGDYAAAVIQYRNALRENPVAETRARLGLAYERDGRQRQAIDHLQRGIVEGADPARYALPLARILFDVGLHAEIAPIPEPVGLEGEDKALLLAYRALGHFLSGDAVAGGALLREAESLQEDLAEVHLARAYRSMAEGDAEGALAAVRSAIDADPMFAPGWVLQAELERQRGEPERALASLDRAVQLRPNHVVERLRRGLVHIELGQLDAAHSDADSVLRMVPRHPGGNFLRGLAYFENGQRSRARPHFEEALAVDRNYRTAMPYLSALHIEEGNLSQAQHFMERYHALGEPTVMAYRLWAQLMVEQGRPEEARELLRKAVNEHPSLLAGLAEPLAALYIDSGAGAEGIQVLRTALAQRSAAPGVLEMLGVALVRQDEVDEGMEILDRVAAASDEVRDSELAVAIEHLRAERYERALEAAQQLLRKQPDHADAVNVQAAALLGLGEVAGARAALEAGLVRHPENNVIAMNLVSLEVRADNEQRAREILAAVQGRDPGHANAAMRLAALEFRRGATDSGIQVLEAVSRENPEALEPQLMLARILANAGDLASASRTLSKAWEHHPENFAVGLALAEVQERRRDFAGATVTLRRLMETRTNEAELHFRLSRSLAGQGQEDASLTELRRVLEIDPEHLAARLVLSRHLTEAGKIEEAREIFGPLTEAAPDAAQVLALQAWFDAQDGDYASAAKGYAKALRQELQRDWVLAKHGVEFAMGDTDAAIATLAEWLEQQPADDVARHRLGEVLFQAGRYPEARTVYEDQLQRRPDEAVTLNNLAWLLREDDTEKALAYARKANELVPGQAPILDTLGVVFLHAGQTQQARQALEQAHQLAPSAPGIGYNLARARHADGDSAAARSLLAALLEEHEQFPERESAQGLLDELAR